MLMSIMPIMMNNNKALKNVQSEIPGGEERVPSFNLPALTNVQSEVTPLTSNLGVIDEETNDGSRI